MPAFERTSLTYIDAPTGIHPALPAVFDDMSLAHTLGIRVQTLYYLITQRKLLYTEFRIPKKSGGTRILHAPTKGLKYVQGQVLSRFLNPYPFGDHVAAYVPGRSTRHSAEVHAGNPLLIVMDLKDFFPSTRRSWVRRALQTRCGYNHQVAALLADLMTIPREFSYGRRYVVPQGAPTSGALCNLVADVRLDDPLLALCKDWGMNYTRYADDLAFSNPERLDRKATNDFIRAVRNVITDSGYRDNRKKLRVARSGRQQRLLGMTVNVKPNIMRLHYKRMRARLHHCYHDGFETVAKEMHLDSPDALKSHIEGMLNYYANINPEKTNLLRAQYTKAVAQHA